MKDLTDKLEVFIITNGRSTYPYCRKSVEQQQDVSFKITVHENMDWLAANQEILKVCESPFFLRIDDDMILHPRAISYMWHCVRKKHKRVALRGWKLWEPYSHKVCKGIKIYSRRIVKNLGGFKINKLGKIDKVFAKSVKRSKYKMGYTNDILAIHSCSTVEEHIKYSVMRGEDKGKKWKTERKWIKKHVGKCKISLEEQFNLRGKFLNVLNKKRRTDFFRFIK